MKKCRGLDGVFPLTKREIFKRRFCRRFIPGGRGEKEMGQGGNRGCGRMLGGSEKGEPRTTMGVLWSSCGPFRDGTQTV